MKHARQVLIEGWDQGAIRALRTLIVGCGALGSGVAVKLARLGVGHIMLMDYDTLEDHNLENQEYDQHDLGKPKVEALADRIRRIDPAVDVRTWIGKFRDFTGDLQVHYILGGLDNVTARYQISARGIQDNAVVIDGGIDRYRGTVTTILPGKTACYHCYDLFSDKPVAPCDEDPIPSTYVTANVTSSFQVTQLIKLVHGLETPSYIYIDLSEGILEASNLDPNPECLRCATTF